MKFFNFMFENTVNDSLLKQRESSLTRALTKRAPTSNLNLNLLLTISEQWIVVEKPGEGNFRLESQGCGQFFLELFQRRRKEKNVHIIKCRNLVVHSVKLRHTPPPRYPPPTKTFDASRLTCVKFSESAVQPNQQSPQSQAYPSSSKSWWPTWTKIIFWSIGLTLEGSIMVEMASLPRLKIISYDCMGKTYATSGRNGGKAWWGWTGHEICIFWKMNHSQFE